MESTAHLRNGGHKTRSGQNVRKWGGGEVSKDPSGTSQEETAQLKTDMQNFHKSYRNDEFAIWTWGSNAHGCILQEDAQYWAPKKIVNFESGVDIRTFQLLRSFVAVVYDFDGRLYSLGMADCAGLGDEEEQKTPKLIVALEHLKITQIAGWDHTLFLTSEGEVYGCGENSFAEAIGHVVEDASVDGCDIHARAGDAARR